MSKSKPALPNLVFDPLALAMQQSQPILEPEPAPEPEPAKATAFKTVKKQKPKGMRQRGLWLSDDTMLGLRIAALKKGMTASRLADAIIADQIKRAS